MRLLRLPLVLIASAVLTPLASYGVSSYATAAADAPGSSTGAAAVALGVPDYRFVNDAGLGFGGTSSAVFGVGESTTLSFAQPLRNIAAANDLLVSAYVGGLGETDSAQVLVEVSSDGASFASIGTFDTATGRTTYPFPQERNFASVKHFALEFGANDLVTHVRLTNIGGSAEGLRLDAVEGLHPVVDSSHAFEIRFERYREDSAQRFFVRLKNTADPGGVAIREFRMIRALNANLEDTRRSMVGTNGLVGEMLCVENCNADNGALIPFSRHVWSLDGVTPAPAGTGIPPGGSVGNLRSESFDTDSSNVPYLAGFSFIVTWADGYKQAFDYSNDVLGQQVVGSLYQKYLYFEPAPALSGPRPVDYYEFRRVSTVTFTNVAAVPDGHEPQPGGRLSPLSHHFVEAGFHVEAFWRHNNQPSFEMGHFHNLENGYETSHGIETVVGLGPDRQGIFLQRVDGGAFDLESLDYRASQATTIWIGPSYDPTQPAPAQLTAFPVSAGASFSTLDLSQFNGVTQLFILADLANESETNRWDNLVLRTAQPVDIAPLANAGADQSVTDADQSGFEPVTLVGTASSDSDGTITSYVWTEGATALGSGATLSTSLAIGTHVVTLRVTDDDGNEATDTTTILVNPAGGGLAPVANPGANQTVSDANDNGVEPVTLDGSASFDPDGTIISYTWSEGATPLGTSAVITPSFVVGVHTVSLTVRDNSGNDTTANVTVTVNYVGPGVSPVLAGFRTSEVTTDQTTHAVSAAGLGIRAGDLLVAHLCVDSTAAPCPAGWTAQRNDTHAQGGVAAALCTKIATASDETAASYSFTTPTAQQSQNGVVVVRGYGPVAPIASVAGVASEVDVSPTSPTFASAPAANAMVLRFMCANGGRVTEGVGFPSGMSQNLWILESADGGSGPVSGGAARDANGANGSRDWLNALSTAEQSVNFSLAIAPGSGAPIANAGADVQDVDLDGDGFESVALSGTGSLDLDGSIVSWQWREGGVLVASGATPTASFAVGVHTVVLTVTDDDGKFATDAMRVTVDPYPGDPPTANAGPDQVVTDNDESGFETVTLNGTGSFDPDGTIVSYVWSEGATTLGSGATLNTSFAVGVHTVTLAVTDDDTNVATDTVTIDVRAGGVPPPAVVGTRTSESVTNLTSHTLLASGLGTQAGDLLVGHVCSDGSPGNTITCPAGWTRNLFGDNGGAVQGALCTKEATAGDAAAASFAYSTSTTQQTQAGLIVLRGQRPITPIEASALNATDVDRSPTSPALAAPPANNSRVLRFMCADGGRVTEGVGYPSGMAQNYWLLESADGASGPVSGGAALDVAGASAARDWTNALAANDESVSFSVAIAASVGEPIANAGPDQSVTDLDDNGFETVTLNGTGSTDAGGAIVSYTWTEGALTLGTGATLNVAFGLGTHVVTLTVEDDDGWVDNDTATVVVNAAPGTAPTANAGPDQVVTDNDENGFETVTLNGTGSFDPNGTLVLYEWTEGASLLGTGATLNVAFAVGAHTVTLTVEDNTGKRASDTVGIDVQPGGRPQLVAFQTSESTTDRTAHTLAAGSLPIASGDLLLAHVCSDGTTGNTLSCPAGWTQVASAVFPTPVVAGTVCTKQATASDVGATSYAYTTSTSQQTQAGLMLIAGHNPASPIEAVATQNNETDTSPLSPAFAAAPSSNSLVLRLTCTDAGRLVAEGSGFPAGMAQNLWALESAVGDSGPVTGGAARAPFGASGAAEWTGALSSAQESVNFSIAIRPE